MNEQAIFLAALDIADAAERAAYVKECCAGDQTLCRQIEALLQAHEKSGEFLDVPALQQVVRGSPADVHSPIDTAAEGSSAGGEINLSFLQPSTKAGSLGRLGHYEVETILGRGGCGIVLKAFDEILHRMVAIKVMAPEMAATSPARKRFLREARAAAAIRHENVVSIHAVEEKPIPFLVMEYIAGQTLQQKLDENGPLEIQDVVQIGKQIANGLAAAHAIGLIHRDIKPSNILMEKNRDLIKITDFGLARATDDASITQSGVIAGTPLYMSPEQAQGAGIDHRSDLFSLGSVLYVMCSGRPPFRAATTLAVLKRVAEDEPRPIQEIIPEVPEWLTAIIGKLLAKKRADRFNSAEEVSLLLARCLSEMQQRGRVEMLGNDTPKTPKPANEIRKPVQATGPKIEDRPVPSRSRWWAAAAAVFMVLLAGLGMTEATGVTNVRGTVIRLFSPDGTLVVEVDDPSVSVSIDGEDMVITGTGAKEIRLKPGQYKVLASKDGKLVRQELVTVTKNGRQVVRVSREQELAPVGNAAPDRRAAEWVLSIGGGVTITDGKERGITTAKDLPPGTWALQRIDLWGNKKASDLGLKNLAGANSLKVLELSLTSVTNAGMKEIAVLKNLHWLNVSSTRISDEGVTELSGLANLSALNLGATGVTDVGVQKLSGLLELQRLELYRTSVSDKALTHLGKITTLTFLDVDLTKVSSAGVEAFRAAVPGCRVKWNGKVFEPENSTTPPDRRAAEWVVSVGGKAHLRVGSLARIIYPAALPLPKEPFVVTKVDLHEHHGVTDAGLANLKGCRHLESLRLWCARVTDVGLGHLAGIQELRVLVLDGTQVRDKGLASFSNCKDLRFVDLSRTPVTGQGLGHLKDCPNLTQLHLNGCKQVDDASLVHFKNHQKLSVLNLYSTQVTDAGLAHLTDCPNLNSILVNNTEITEKGLAQLKNLTFINAQNSAVGPGIMEFLTAWPNLETINLVNVRLNDRDLGYLKEAKKLSSIALGSSRITDKGLSALKDCPQLTYLLIASPSVTDRGVEHLQHLVTLHILDVKGTNMTPAETKKLAGALPHCRIHWNGGVFEPTTPWRFTNALGMEFALVPRGKSWLGGGNGRPGEKEVEFKDDFYLGVYEVTQEEWHKVTGLSPSQFSRTGLLKNEAKDISEDDLKRFPVENVSGEDAKMFLDELNRRDLTPGWEYRLPTADEWEYACRGGPVSKLDSAFDFYFEKPLLELSPGQANTKKAMGPGRPCKVGMYPPNKLGLYDMHGNISEWCANTMPSPVSKGMTARTFMGSNWGTDVLSDARYRGWYTTTVRNPYHGLRVARVLVRMSNQGEESGK